MHKRLIYKGIFVRLERWVSQGEFAQRSTTRRCKVVHGGMDYLGGRNKTQKAEKSRVLFDREVRLVSVL